MHFYSFFLCVFFFWFCFSFVIWKGHKCKKKFTLLNIGKGLNIAKGATTQISYSHAIIEVVKRAHFETLAVNVKKYQH